MMMILDDFVMGDGSHLLRVRKEANFVLLVSSFASRSHQKIAAEKFSEIRQHH
jgi:hypothetical protein